MHVKFRRLIAIYAAAALISLGTMAWAAETRLNTYRRAAGYSAARAFEEAVTAAEGLSRSLRALDYVTDPALGKSLCADAQAQALAAETALSVLPFATEQLEGLSGFLNRAGDYAGSLCALPEDALSEDDRQHLADMSAAAAALSEQLRQLQGQLHDGSIAMDSRETPLRNIGEETRTRLSEGLLDYEGSFAAPAAFAYEGQFSPREERAPGTLTEAEGRALAARAAGVEQRELRQVFTAEGPEGRRCYSAAGLLIGVSGRGLEYAARSRLVGPPAISAEKARQNAEKFLADNGFGDLTLADADEGETLAAYSFVPVQDGALRLDDGVRVTIALDDGSLCAFDAANYDTESVDVSWNTDEQAARDTLPPSLTVEQARRVIIRSPGGRAVACWQLVCTGEADEAVTVYVDASDGRQCRVDLE